MDCRCGSKGRARKRDTQQHYNTPKHPPPTHTLYAAPTPPQTKRQAEDALSKLVVAKAVDARIDRPAGVVTIGRKQAPEDVLNAWSANIAKLLALVDAASQQVQKEAVVHKVALGGAA